LKVLLFGATGMVGQGVLRECLLDTDIDVVQTVGRSATGVKNAKLREIVHANLFDCTAIEADLRGFDGCFFCLGVTSAGKSEAEYTRLTYDLTVAVAQTLARVNTEMPPPMTFVYVSGKGTDTSERGRLMWARVKGKTENAILRLRFKAAYMFRPGVIQPMHGERPKVAAYRAILILTEPLIPVLRKLFPGQILTTEEMGRAMIRVALRGYSKGILESADIIAVSIT
jgi:uncharacterized protein YbjT (DUF2867 family)